MAVGIGEALDNSWNSLGSFFDFQAAPNPELFQIALVVFGGFVLGRVLSEVVLRIMRMTSIDEIGVKSDIQLALRKFNYHGTVSSFIADIIKWSVYTLTLLTAVNLFGSDLLTEYSGLAMVWASKLVLTMFIVIVGLLLSERIGSIVIQIFRVGRISGRVDETHAEIPLYIVVGQIVKYIGYLITTVIALSFIGVDGIVIYILVAVLSLGLTASIILSSHRIFENIAISLYLQVSRMFRGGEYVTIGEYHGEIVSIRPLYTKIKSNGKIFYVPNTKLLSQVVEYDGEGE